MLRALFIAAAAILGLAILIMPAGAQMRSALREQTTFSGDEPLQRPVALPTPVLKMLLDTEKGKQALEAENPDESAPSKWFHATEVHLAQPGQIDLVIVGSYPMSGADNTWFWVVRNASKAPRIVLFTGGNGLRLLNGRTNGYRDVRTSWASPREVVITEYKFIGGKYKQTKQNRKENPY
jgi:hypothetical protein